VFTFAKRKLWFLEKRDGIPLQNNPHQKEVHIGVFASYDRFGTTKQPSPLPLGMHKMGATFFDLMINEVLLVCHRVNFLVIYTCTP
jgi:hypothetical protein